MGLERISEWGRWNYVSFNASKTCFIPISLSRLPSDYSISFENVEIPPLTSINMLGLEISTNLSWRTHIGNIAKSASRKLGVLFRCCNFLSFAELLQLYVRTHSSVCGVVLHTFAFLTGWRLRPSTLLGMHV